KKLLQIGGSINYGAPGKITEQIGLLAMSKGWEVCVAHSSRNENPSQLQHYAMTTRWQEMVHALGAKFLDLHGLLSTKQTRDLVERIKDYQPDIIHLHNIHGYFCNFKVLFEYLDSVDTPVVWTLHDCWPFTGRCFHFVGANCYKWKTGCYDCKAEPGYTVSKYYDRSKELFALKKRLFSSVKNLTLVPVSDWQAAFLKDSFLKDCNVHRIHNGVDIEKFKPLDGNRLREKHKLNGKFVILGVASPWNTRKGLNDFYQLHTMLSDEVAIVMVGLTPKQIEKLPKGIIGIARTESQQELAEYYSIADVFVNLTYLDTFPTVNLEALACGTPVITYRTGGSPEAISDVENVKKAKDRIKLYPTGLVVEQGDIAGIVNAIRELQVHPLSAEDCRKRAETYFDKDRCFEEYIRLYDSLISNKY
ncbi:MAG: glycosyltransferase, partial [Prevotella sp.]